MAINLQIYSNVNNTTKTITMDFVSEIAAITTDSAIDDSARYYFKMSTSARDTNSLPYNVRVVEGLDDLALNKTVQSASNVSADYSNVKSMIIDYTYDYINGHDADQFLSGVSVKAPMKFT